jgi:uncharacterized protein (DUF1499 family)
MHSMSAPSVWPRTFLRLARYAAVIGAGALVLAGPGYRWRLLSFDVAIKGPFLLGVLLAFAALALGGFALLGSRAGRGEPRAWRNWLAFAFGAVVVLAAAFWYGRLRSAPMLHDVSTDTVHPPPFVEVVARREADHASNGADYVREYTVDSVAVNAPELQKEAYPEVQPVMLRLRPAEAFTAADKAARAMGWEIAASVPAEGRIEATDTSLYFGLKDDIAIRVRSEINGRGTVIDVRSSSRVGANDAGANARRIRAYADRLKQPSR